MARIFVAIPVPQDVATVLARVVPDDLRALRPVAPELLHVTLAFVGQIDEVRVAEAVAAVEAAAPGAGRAVIEIDRIGRFPPTGRPRFLWAGTGTAAAWIEALGARVRAELTRRQVPFDPKPLRAHITLARLREGASAEEARAVSAAARAAQVPAGLAFAADAVHVMESTLSPRGPRYSSRARIPLNEAS